MFPFYADLSSDPGKKGERVDRTPGFARIDQYGRMAYTCVYAKPLSGGLMQRKAKVFMNNRSQAVRLPKEFQFSTQEVFIRKEGSEVVLSPRPFDWTSYLAEAPVASANFMEDVEDLPVQEREP
jgi:antitoxin VapB